MSRIRIATDSTADIPKSFCEEMGIAVFPLTIIVGELVGFVGGQVAENE